MEALIEAEMETMGSGPMDGKPRLGYGGDLYDDDDDDARMSMEMEYDGGDDSAGLDESDEKMLLYRELTFANMVV